MFNIYNLLDIFLGKDFRQFVCNTILPGSFLTYTYPRMLFIMHYFTVSSHILFLIAICEDDTIYTLHRSIYIRMLRFYYKSIVVSYKSLCISASKTSTLSRSGIRVSMFLKNPYFFFKWICSGLTAPGLVLPVIKFENHSVMICHKLHERWMICFKPNTSRHSALTEYGFASGK